MNNFNNIVIFITIFFSTSLTILCKGQVAPCEYDSTRVVVKAERLRDAYSKVKEKGNIESKKHFFYIFPSTFCLLDEVYGYKNGPHVLYNVYYTHLNLFCSLKNVIERKQYDQKLIGLGINGHWDADAINFLQHCIIENVKKDPLLTVKILKDYPKQKIRSFWHFFYDGPHPDHPLTQALYKEIFRQLKHIDPPMASLMGEEYQRLLKE